ncbi:MAG: DNRLRE domain-containing protein, partial [Thermoplasmata archaeon]|nr:DNRLRE domain-containing protein [Thermoplasmata archaeon]
MKPNQQPLFIISKGLTVIVILMLVIGFLPLIGTNLSDDRTIEIQDENNELLDDAFEVAPHSSRSSARFTDTFDLQPDWEKGMDTFLAFEGSTWVDRNFGNETYFGVGGDTRDYRGLIQFDLSALPPPNMPIQKAYLKLFFYGKTGTDPNPVPVRIHRVKQAWTEGSGTTTVSTSDGATWNNYNGVSAWSDPGGFF